MQAVFAAQEFARVDRMRTEARADAERAGRKMTDVVERGIRLELAAALRVTEYAAGALIGHAEALVHRYPTALDALAGGRITVRHAEMLADMLDELEPHLRDRLVTPAVELAETRPVGVFRRRLRALIDNARAATLAERHAEALTSRRVFTEPADDGMAWLMALMPAVEAHAAMNRITEMGRRIVVRNQRSTGRGRARADPAGSGERAVRRGGWVDAGAHSPGDRDGPVCGAREVPSAAQSATARPVARRPVHGSRLLRPGISLRDRPSPPASPPAASRRAEPRRRGPNVAWEHGGHTSLDNNCPFCKGHHLVKHHGGWGVRQIPGSGGAVERTSPAGRRYIVEPERRVPTFTTTITHARSTTVDRTRPGDVPPFSAPVRRGSQHRASPRRPSSS